MHDGSETTEDSMILELTLVAGTGYTLPGYLQGHLRFPLHVNVTPVNDPPLLEIPTAKVLRLAQVRHEHKLYKFPFFWLNFSFRDAYYTMNFFLVVLIRSTLRPIWPKQNRQFTLLN